MNNETFKKELSFVKAYVKGRDAGGIDFKIRPLPRARGEGIVLIP